MSTGIDFIINGKDKAAPAMASVERSLGRMQKQTTSLAASTSRLTSVTGGLVAAYAAVRSVLALVGGMQKLNAAYDQQTEAVKGLETALSLAGGTASDFSASLQQTASDLQSLTGVGDEVTIGLMRQASMMGIQADKLDDVARASIGLAEATGKNLPEAMKLVRQATQGEFGAFGELIPQIKSLQSDEEKLALVMGISTKGFEAKIAASNRLSGMSDRASGAIGDLMESVGALLAPMRLLINAGLKVMAEVLQQALAPAVEKSNAMMEKMGEWVTWLRNIVIAAVNNMIAAFTFLEVTITNFDSVWQFLVASAEASLHALAGSFKHYLTEVIPAYAIWLKDNLPGMIKSAITGGDAELSQLPQIAARQMTERERELQAKMASIGDNLGQAFADKYAERMIKVTDSVKDISKEIRLNATSDEAAMTMDAKTSAASPAAVLQATQGRLLTRGQASENPVMESNRLLKGVAEKLNALIGVNENQIDVQENIAAELGNTIRLVPIA